MSKKLIAVAAAAALAITGLVGVAPASATPTITYTANAAISIADGTTNGTGLGTDAKPFLINVPSGNALEYPATIGSTTTAIKVTAGSLVAGSTVNVTTTGSVRVVDALFSGSSFANVLTTGKTSHSYTVPAGGAATYAVYVYTTSTAKGTFTVTVNKTDAGVTSSASETKVLQGLVGPAYNLALAAPSTLALDAVATLNATVTDVFGNAIESGTPVTVKFTPFATMTAATVTPAWDAPSKSFKETYTSTSSDPIAFSAAISATAVAGLAAPKNTIYAVVNAAGASDLAAKVAELQKIVDRKVTKKRFNTLAKKWNAAFPSQAVKLKK
jgi:hypothetical protein